ncbi:MAG: Hsp33 family molecular chaperone HslO [Mariprofundus sp.]|nr:Hsp33 family molecular chaperone HslO [Mariprofundus sp.]
MAEETDRLMTDPLTRFLLPDSHSRGVIIRASHIFAEANRIHGLNGPLAELFDQSLLASILLLSISKGGTRQVLQLNAINTSPLKKILAEAGQGSVRGYIDWRESQTILHHDSKRNENANLTSWLGNPIRLSTVRDLGFGQPYVSTLEHESDYLADHLLHYLNQSVQIRADIILHGDLAIMVEAMPGCNDDHWFKTIEAMAKIPNQVLAEDSTENILSYFNDLNIQPAGTDNYAYHCGCSPEKMIQAVKSLPADQLASLADEAGNITTSCQYCTAHHVIPLHQMK